MNLKLFEGIFHPNNRCHANDNQFRNLPTLGRISNPQTTLGRGFWSGSTVGRPKATFRRVFADPAMLLFQHSNRYIKVSVTNIRL